MIIYKVNVKHSNEEHLFYNIRSMDAISARKITGVCAQTIYRSKTLRDKGYYENKYCIITLVIVNGRLKGRKRGKYFR